MTRNYEQACPVARTLDIVGDRWTLLILRDLFFDVARFNDFIERSPGMPTKVLSARLKKLEAHGFVQRELYSQHPLRAEYRLTEKGRSLRPVLQSLADWGMEHLLSAHERKQIPSLPDEAGS
ncbi:MAG: helix-turn-helix domain-containing protein [Dehalococcoidia bacterium]